MSHQLPFSELQGKTCSDVRGYLGGDEIRWRGRSNGYYSERVSFELVSDWED